MAAQFRYETTGAAEDSISSGRLNGWGESTFSRDEGGASRFSLSRELCNGRGGKDACGIARGTGTEAVRVSRISGESQGNQLWPEIRLRAPVCGAGQPDAGVSE